MSNLINTFLFRKRCFLKVTGSVNLRGSDLLHSFYTGIERILEMIASMIDEYKPSGEHRELLLQVATFATFLENAGH